MTSAEGQHDQEPQQAEHDPPPAREPARIRRWWQRMRPGYRRAVRATVALIGTGLVALVVGVSTAHYTGALGPHAASFSTTLNQEITVNMGPLGSLIVDSPLPAGLGVDVTVEQIPDELTIGGEEISVDADNAIAGLTADLSSYLQFFTDPGTTIRTAAFGLIGNALERTVLFWSMMLTAIMLGRLMAHGVLRTAARSAWHRPGVPAVVATLAATLIIVPIVPATRGSSGEGSTSTVLAGTPLEQARITGRLGALVDHYGAVVLDTIDDNSEFYDEVESNVRAAFAQDSAAVAPQGQPLTAPTYDPEPDDSDDSDDDSAGGDSADEETADPADSADPAATADEESEPRDIATLVVVADLHCNVGMGSVIGAAVEESQADMVLNLGDAVMGGTAVESICVNAFDDGFGQVPVVSADGNHDSAETAQQERDRGWTVLDGDPVEVEGMRFIGDTDPTLTSLGESTRQVEDESFGEIGERLRDRSCEQAEQGDPVDMVLMHNPKATDASLSSGCVPLALAGHFHRRIGPWQQGLGVQYVSSSSAGATYKVPTIGPLRAPASVTVMRYDRANHEPLTFRTIVIDPDKDVDLSPWYAFPDRPEEDVQTEWPAPGTGPWLLDDDADDPAQNDG